MSLRDVVYKVSFQEHWLNTFAARLLVLKLGAKMTTVCKRDD